MRSIDPMLGLKSTQRRGSSAVPEKEAEDWRYFMVVHERLVQKHQQLGLRSKL